MKTLRYLAVFLAAVTGFIGIMQASAQADTMNWRIRSFSRYAVNVKFYSQNRGHVWPAVNRAYTIRDYNVTSISLNCVRGEKICYGASVSGNSRFYWGTGIDGKQACKGCCFVCNGTTTTPIMNLNER